MPTYKDINLLTQKATIAGTEKLPVSDTEYITPGQMLSTEVSVPLSGYDPVMTLPGGSNKWVTDNQTYPAQGIFIACEGGDTFTFTCPVERQVSFCFLTSPYYVNGTNVDYATGYSGNGEKTDYGGGIVIAPSDAKYVYVFTTGSDGTTDLAPTSITKNGNIVDVIGELQDEISELKNGKTKNIVSGKYLYSDGTERVSSSWYYTEDYIPVAVGDMIDYVPGATNASACIVVYDSSKSVVGYWTANAAHRTIQLTSSATAYIRVSLATAAMSTARVVVNSKIVWKPVAEDSGGVPVTVDSQLSSTSENPVQNKVIYVAIGDIETLLASI